jgi:hypothetical protein
MLLLLLLLWWSPSRHLLHPTWGHPLLLLQLLLHNTRRPWPHSSLLLLLLLLWGQPAPLHVALTSCWLPWLALLLHAPLLQALLGQQCGQHLLQLARLVLQLPH